MGDWNADGKWEIPEFWVGIRKDWEDGEGGLADELVELSWSQLKTHALVLGATGSGKTTLLHHLIQADMRRHHSIAVLDMRGDLVQKVLELCAWEIEAQRVRIIDLRDPDHCLGFDPLHGSGESYFRALGVLDVVASESESWGVQLSETLRNALMLLAEAGERLTTLERLFYDRAFRHSCIKRSDTDHVTEFWQRFDSLSADRQAALASPVLNKVSALFATKTLRRLLSHPDPFDLKQHLDSKGSITLVSLAVDETHSSGRMLGSLVLASICREVFSRVQVPERFRNPVRLFVDEFEHFGTRDFETILAEGRRFGLHAVLAHQTLAQLTPKMRSLILGNVGTKVVFRTGREDSSTLGKDIFGHTHFDFTKLPTGEAILGIRNEDPIHVEMNEPLKSNSYSAVDALCFKRLVYEFAQQDESAIRKPKAAPEVESHPPQPPSDLGDWLCD
ncbi:MAG: type IV secretion system DNA-binding domain-containing protein [Armatimonadetes bacterium]|nr:type IV secretion system DNA-binding domain-containing protein [Armatimonadota bacterium]